VSRELLRGRPGLRLAVAASAYASNDDAPAQIQNKLSSEVLKDSLFRLGPTFRDRRGLLDQVLPFKLGPEGLRNGDLHRTCVRQRLRFGMRSDDQ
jgi:hypothetical protein